MMSYMDESIREKEEYVCRWCHGTRSGYCWGLFLIVFGLYFLARDLGWVTIDFPLWQIVLIAFGVYLLLPRRKK